ncbi:MAG: hypothetical protein M1834_005371 [Cirrosporium novae-zelandiae]|nr:MAG: hypothetical protein M1834_005371 [Cirrosporium novae-zelandiae]
MEEEAKKVISVQESNPESPLSKNELPPRLLPNTIPSTGVKPRNIDREIDNLETAPKSLDSSDVEGVKAEIKNKNNLLEKVKKIFTKDNTLDCPLTPYENVSRSTSSLAISSLRSSSSGEDTALVPSSTPHSSIYRRPSKDDFRSSSASPFDSRTPVLVGDDEAEDEEPNDYELSNSSELLILEQRMIHGCDPVSIDPEISVIKHPSTERAWDSRNLWCKVCGGHCAICEAPCCVHQDLLDVTNASSIDMDWRQMKIQQLRDLEKIEYLMPKEQTTFLMCTTEQCKKMMLTPRALGYTTPTTGMIACMLIICEGLAVAKERMYFYRLLLWNRSG